MIRKRLAGSKWLLGFVFGAVVVGGATLSTAGMKSSNPLTVNLSTRWAEGTLGTVRNSSNPSEWISCYITGSGVGCGAFDGRNHLSCHHAKSRSNYTSMLAAVQALDGDSLVQFKANSDGSCGELWVTDGSYFEPKVR